VICVAVIAPSSARLAVIDSSAPGLNPVKSPIMRFTTKVSASTRTLISPPLYFEQQHASLHVLNRNLLHGLDVGAGHGEAGLSEDTIRPAIRISPPSGVSIPAMHRSKVVFPEPLAPTMTKSSPSAISRSRALTAVPRRR